MSVLLREYVKEVLSEDLYFCRPKLGKKKQGLLSKAKSFFTGHGKADSFFNDWVEDQEMYGVDVEAFPDLRDKIKNFVRVKYPVAIIRSKGKADRVDSIMRRAINNKFRKELNDLKAKSEDLDDETL